MDRLPSLARSCLLAALVAAGCSGRAEEPRGAVPSNEEPIASASTLPSPPASSAAPVAAEPPVDPAAVLAQASDPCASSGAVLVSPDAPDASRALRVLLVTRGAAPSGVVARAPDGSASISQSSPRHGPPASIATQVDRPSAGTWRFVAHRAGKAIACHDVEVAEGPARVDRIERSNGAWRATRGWSRPEEDLYSAWVEALFDTPNGDDLSVGSLHAITQDPARNLLHDHLRLGEDQPPPKGLRLDPDCADLPYFLRAYFAWKRGLPFGFSRCSRGGQGRAPTCLERNGHVDMGDLEEPPRDRTRRMEAFLRRRLKDTVHSGTGRTEGSSDETDYYPVALTDANLRPGAIYADPYGHILVVAKRVPPANGAAGILFAVDGQPDGTVARKRFWKGNFLFADDDPAFGSPGFKRFRPVKLKGGEVRGIGNDQLSWSSDWGDFSIEQDSIGQTGFYDRMDEIISPDPLDPERALVAAIDALDEQVRARVRSVDNAEKHKGERGGAIDMPKGPAIFETTGDWENFSTPARDLRLLVAIDVVRGFPGEVLRRPARFLLAGKPPAEVKTTLEARLARELAARRITYARSDGRPQELSLAEVVQRSVALEVAYNPNDCPEVRWAAPEGTEEAGSCVRRASGAHRAQMERHRAWFKERKRPPRP